MKKIIFFSRTLQIGGMEKSLVILLNELVNYYNITLYLEFKTGELLDNLNDKIKVKEYRLSNNKNWILRKIFNFIKRYNWYLKNYNKYDFSCCYATYSRLCSLLALKASKNNSVYIHSNYYDMFNGNFTKINNFFKYINIFKFKKIIHVSNESLASINKIYPFLKTKSYVINNLFDIPKNKSIITKKNDDFIRYTFIGRIEEASKNVKRLFDAFKILIKTNPNNILTIVGEGPDYLACKQYADDINIFNKVKFTGMLFNPIQEIIDCDYIVLSSNYEGNPVVYMEALYYNKPIVTTVKTSDKYINIEDYGIVSEKSAESLAYAMKQIINKKIKININFEEINRLKIKEIINLIEEV